MKTCPKCREEKPLDAFSRQAKSRDGHYPYCKACTSAMHKVRYARLGKQWFTDNKVCTWCKEAKPRAEYEKDAGKEHARCKSCEAEIAKHEGAGLRFCNICRKWLETSAFYPSKLHLQHVTCGACTRAQMTQPAYQLRRRNYYLQKEYGITLDQYKELLERQGHKCPICKVPFEPGNFSYPVDHAHGGPNPGVIRAILHQDCNRFVMWMHEDSAQLRAAADLIDNPLTDWIVLNPTLNERRREKERQT